MAWKNKVAVITGATTGIGKATKALLRSNGVIVYNLDRHQLSEAEVQFSYHLISTCRWY